MFTLWVHWPFKQKLVLLVTLASFLVVSLNFLLGPYPLIMYLLLLTGPIALCAFWFDLATAGWVTLVSISIIIPQWFRPQTPELPFIIHMLTILALAFLSFRNLDKETRLHQQHIRAMRILLQRPSQSYKAVDYSREAVLFLDQKGQIIEVSPHASKLLGIPQLSLEGKNIHAIFPALPGKLNTSAAPKGEFSWRNNHGQSLVFEYLIRHLVDQTGPSGTLLLLFDISEEKRKMEAYLQTAKFSVIGQVSAGLAHEIRNPLTTIKGFMQLIGPEQWPERWSSYHQLILDEIQTTDRLLENFLLLTNPSAPRLQPLFLHRLLNSTVEILQALCSIHEVSIVSKVPSNFEPILGDEDQLRQALMSILQNAIDASPSGAMIILTLSQTATFLEVSIEDHGQGIPSAIQDRIFEPFFTTHNNGTGLGLTIAQQITTAHQGQLILSQPETGPGTVAILRFPILQNVTPGLSA